MDRKHRGAWAELMACGWLMEHGYEVFRNVSPSGPIDLVAIKDTVVELIDVKLVTVAMVVDEERLGAATTGGGGIHGSQRVAGIKALYVSPDGFCSFRQADIRALYETIYKSHWDAQRNGASPPKHEMIEDRQAG